MEKCQNKANLLAWFKRGLQLRAAVLDARRAKPQDPRPPRWGLAGYCQLDPSHPTASGNLRLGHRAPGRGGRRASMPLKALTTLLSFRGAFCLFERRICRICLNNLRSICSGNWDAT